MNNILSKSESINSIRKYNKNNYQEIYILFKFKIRLRFYINSNLFISANYFDPVLAILLDEKSKYNYTINL